MIKELALDCLESRREKTSLNLMYKLTHKLINIDTANHLESHSEMRTRGSLFRLNIVYLSFIKMFLKFHFFQGRLRIGTLFQIT